VTHEGQCTVNLNLPGVTHADAAADLKKENHGHGQCSVEFTIEVVRSSEPARVDAVVEKLVYWPLGFGWWLRAVSNRRPI
jgi:hypothetical protein